jgi:mannitol-specific phosphotransferase system IIBC component
VTLQPHSNAGLIRAVLMEHGWDTPNERVAELIGPVSQYGGRHVDLLSYEYIGQVKNKFKKMRGQVCATALVPVEAMEWF